MTILPPDIGESSDPIEPITGDTVHSPKLTSQSLVRKFVSRNGFGYLAIGIVDASSSPVDPDGVVTLKIWFNDLSGLSVDPRGSLIITADSTTGVVRDDIGKFHYDISPAYTSAKGTLSAEWSYQINGTPVTFGDNMQILEQMPYYETLTDDAKLIVEQASWYFADGFDSTEGGPWLQENFQTHFNYERIAFLMGQAVMKLNVTGYPVTNWGVSVDDPAIPKNFKALSVWATKLEIMRHLIVSYIEQPTWTNMQTTYTDRRDYPDRWRAQLEEEKPLFEKAVKLSKRPLLGLGRGVALVGGGIFGGSANGIFMSGMYSMQARAARFYPAAPSVSWGSQMTGGAW